MGSLYPVLDGRGCDDGCWCLLYFDRRALRFMVNDEVVVMVISEMNDGWLLMVLMMNV